MRAQSRKILLGSRLRLVAIVGTGLAESLLDPSLEPEIFGGARGFTRLAEQAIELATAALMASQRFQEAGAAGAFAAARAAIGDLRGTCMACHQQYRERDADGNWRIKSGS